MIEQVKIRGLVRISAWIFGGWGATVASKALYDLFWGEPEANLYSPHPWDFVTKEQWLRYGGFELAYGFSCLALCWFLLRFSGFLPEMISRPQNGNENL